MDFSVGIFQKRIWLAVALALLSFGAMSWSAVRQKSTTFDEIAHITAGCSYWLYGDYRLHPENGVLPQRLEALPLVAGGVQFPSRGGRHWIEANVWELGYTFFYELGNDVRQMLWRARGMTVLMGMALGGIVYVWSRQLFGISGGLVSLTLYVFCPSILAHAALATSDLMATAMFVAALGSCWMALHKVTPLSIAASGLALGLLAVSKMSAIIILPVVFLLLVLRMAMRRPLIVRWRNQRDVVVGEGRQLAILGSSAVCQAALVVSVIWLAYGLQPTIFRTATPGVDRLGEGETVDSLSRGSGLGPCIRFANDWRLLPEPFLWGFSFALEASKSRVSFLNGEFSTKGFTWYFPTAFALKTPIATMLVMLAAFATPMMILRRGNSTGRRRVKRILYRAAPLLVFIMIYWWIALRTNLNIGHRHILPTYPMLFILCGAAACWFSSPRRWVRAVPVFALAWLVVESLGIYPHYLAYFNALAGGPLHGYRHLVDSSLDWGQDLPGLKRWIVRRRTELGDASPVYLSYFGTGNPAAYGVDAIGLPSSPDWRTRRADELRPGHYCISATMLQAVYAEPRGPWSDKSERDYQQLRAETAAISKKLREDPALPERMMQERDSAHQLAAWFAILGRFDSYQLNRLCAYLRPREPDDQVGYSILIYTLSSQDLDAALNQPFSSWDESGNRTR